MRGCNCGAHVPQRVIDAAADLSRKVADGTYRTLDLADLSEGDFNRWLQDKSVFGEFDGYSIGRLSREKFRLALFSGGKRK